MSGQTDDPASLAAWRAKWESEARRSRFRWRFADPCTVCGEWVGHFSGSAERDGCSLIPLNVPLDELRPNCVDVRRLRIADAIRAATSARPR